MKKIIAILAVIALMTAMMIAVSAAGEPTIVVNPATVENGQVKVEISIKNNPGITNGKARFTYDSALTLKDIETHPAIMGVPNIEKDLISFSSTGVQGDVVLFTLIFDVAANADCGDYNVTVTFDKLKAGNADLTDAVVVEDGVATVAHNYVKTGETTGVCGAPNTITWTCTDCGDSYDETVGYGAHVNVVHVEAVAPGCHMTGNIEHWYCTECGLVWQDAALTQITNHMNVILPATGGEVVHVGAKDPTCTENGNIEHWYCETCEQVWQDAALTQLTNHKNVIIGALGHDVSEEYACDETGHWHKCSRCDYVTAVEAHVMEDVVITEPGKYTEGLKIQVCSICGWTDNKDIIIPPTGDTANILAAVIGAFSSVAAAAYVTMKRK